MSQHRTWDEKRSPQWKYLFQKESANRRRTRKEIERERKITLEEQNNNNEEKPLSRAHYKRGNKNIRKVSKEQLKAKIDATNNEIKKLLKYNAYAE